MASGTQRARRVVKYGITNRTKLEPTKREKRAAAKAKRLAKKKTARTPHPETIKRRKRKAAEAALNTLPVCPISRDEIPEKDRIFAGQSHKLPGQPGRVSVWRWINRGVPYKNGGTARLKLPAFRSGSRRWTSLRHFAWWQAELDKADATTST